MAVKSTEGNWFLIECSWQKGADVEAVNRFHDVYDYLYKLAPEYGEKGRAEIAAEDPNDPRLDVVSGSLKPLNLIGRRKFVIICQTNSNSCNRLLQALSKKISLGAPIDVEIFPATYVSNLMNVLPERQQAALK